MKFKAFLLAVLSALLFTLSWPGVGQMWVLSFFSFLPLFWLHQWRMNGSITSTAYTWFIALAFFLWNAGSVYFLFHIDDSLGIKLLSFLTPVVINTIWMTGVLIGFSKITRRSGQSLGLLFLACGWLGVEWAQHHWALAFPWITLGNVMGPHPNWIQWYSITGVAGGSLLVLLMNFGFYRISTGPRKANLKWGMVIACLCIPLVWSSLITSKEDQSEGETKRFTIVQPCLQNDTEKFDPDLMPENLSRSLQLINGETSAGIIVLPETFVFDPGKISGPAGNLGFSGLWIHDTKQSAVIHQLREYLTRSGVAGIVTGAYMSKFYPELETAPAFAYSITDIGAGVVHYNSALLLDSSNTQFRHKTMLVAGVERIPFAQTLPILNELALDFGGVAGSLGEPEEPRAAELAGSSLGVQICYDSAFGWLSNELVRDGADALVVITNDSWWGNTPGHLQLLSFAQLRAIETGRAVVRSANNGISAIISPEGEIVEHLPWNKKGAITRDVEVRTEHTIYTKWGDYIYLLATLCLPVVLLYGLLKQRKSS